MKRFDLKSMAAGLLIGAIGVTSAFAAGGGLSATYSGAKVTVNGVTIPLKSALVSVTQEGEKDASLYMPVRELSEALGYTVAWDNGKNTVALTSRGGANPVGDAVNLLSLYGTEQKRMAVSGSFEGEAGKTMTIQIISTIQGGTVDLFLFDPSGKEQRITIGSSDITKEIPLSEGTWAYNCSGFYQSGTLRIVGTTH